MKKLILLLFFIMCLAQWIVPAKMIYDSETIIADGTLYKFKTQPIDPSDPFRGKYITLSFDANSIVLPDSGDWQSGEEVFVIFTADSSGYAKAWSISREEPEEGPFLRTTVTYVNTYDQYELFFNLPFDRFYLEESKASQAEQVYWQAQRDSAQVAYGLISMGDGAAVIKDVMINDRSISDIVEELNVNN